MVTHTKPPPPPPQEGDQEAAENAVRQAKQATPKRKRGRPKGSKNKVKRGPGRPKGSKNKTTREGHDAFTMKRGSARQQSSRALKPLVAAVVRAIGGIDDRETRDLLKAYCEVAIQGCEIFASKQKDYGPGNIAGGGAFGVLIRMRDKIERMMNLAGKSVTNESKEDTATDAHVYGGILQLVMSGRWPRVNPNPRLAL